MTRPNPLLIVLALAAIVLIAVNLAGHLPLPHRTGAPALAGHPRVVDGDTLVLDGTRIRLFGIDAPESAQTCERDGANYACGQEAKRYLETLIANRPVACQTKDRDRYGRDVAICTAADTDLNAAMVSAGWAVAYRQYSALYVPNEDDAQRRHAGLWSGRFEIPSDWRRQQRGQ